MLPYILAVITAVVAGLLIESAKRSLCDSSGLSDTGGSQIMVPTGGSKDEPVEIGSAAEAASVYGRV